MSAGLPALEDERTIRTTPSRPTPPPPPAEDPYEDDAFSPMPGGSSVFDPDGYEEDDEDEGFLPSAPTPPPARERRRERVVDPIYEEDDPVDEDFEEEDEEEEETPEEKPSRSKPTRSKPTRSKEGREKPERPSKEKKGGLFSFAGGKKQRDESDGEERSPRGERRPPRRDAIPTHRTEDTSIDEESLTLKPFGSHRSAAHRAAARARDGEFDERTNIRARAQKVRVAVVALMSGLFLLGVARAVMPDNSYDEEQIRSMAREEAGDNGYPLKNGEGFAKDFMTAYLTADPKDPYAGKVLNYFYNGATTGDDQNGQSNFSYNSDYAQKIIYGPTIYSSKATTPTTADYTVGAFVTKGKTSTNNQGTATVTNDGMDGSWMFFSLTVFYDKATNSYRVAPKSPNVLPPAAVAPQEILPPQSPIGTGTADEELTKTVGPTVVGFIKAYAESTSQNHAAIDPYITDVTNVNLIQGMGGAYKLPASDEEAITYVAYPTATPGRVQVQATVQWIAEASKGVNGTFSSSYIITLLDQGNGKYLVDKIVPETYFPTADEE